MELHKRMILLVLGDMISALLSLPAALFIRSGNIPVVADLRGLGPGVIFTYMGIVVFSSFLVEFYRNHNEMFAREMAVKIGFSLGLSAYGLALFTYSLPADYRESGILAVSLVIFGLLQFLCHFMYRHYVSFKGFARRILVLGVGPLARHVGAIIPSTDENYVLSGYVNCSNETCQVPSGHVVENGDSLYETVRRQKADKIVVSLSERRGVFPFREVMALKLSGIEIVDAPSFYEKVTGKLFLEGINPSWIIFSDGFKVHTWLKTGKRFVDILCSLIGIALTLPFFPLIALAIKLDSPGPVFYRQERVGERERAFVLYKFRTMRADAESGTGPVWAQKNDSRVTRLGNFFRKCRIDELPQFINVLRGDMSMVGPRPERPEFVEQLKERIPYYSERHFVKPGVTGWAQVRYPYGASVEDAVEKLRYDLYYIKNISLSFDLMIILETIQVVLFRRGGR